MRSYGLPHQRVPRKLMPLFCILLFVVCALAGSCWATQKIAEAYAYHPALGAPVWGKVYLPWSWIVWQQRFNDPQGIIATAIEQGQMVFIAPLMVVFAVLLQFMRKPEGRADLHGSAKWATKEEIEAAGLLNRAGVYVGGWMDKARQLYLRHNGPEHILAFAPTRSGKGVGLVLPTLLSWPGSALILDIKGENWALTAGWRQSQGHKVLRFDPSDPSEAGVRINPLLEVRLDGPRAIPDAQNVASMIVDPDGKGLKDYWNKAAFSFFAGAVLHCMLKVRLSEKRDATLCDLSCMLADENRSIRDVFEEMLETNHVEVMTKIFGQNVAPENAQAMHTFIAAAAREMLNKADSELSGVVSTAVANIALYRDPVVARNTSASDFRISDLMNHEAPVSLYLVISPADMDRLRPLLRLIINVILRRLTERMEFEDGATRINYRHRLLLMIDEFPSLGRLEIFERALAFMAGYGVKAYLIVQDLAQLQKEYGKDESIVSNCHVRIAYAPNKVETAKVLSEMTGKTTVIEKKTTLSGARAGHLNHANVSITETARALLTPDECMRLPGAKKNVDGLVTAPGDMLVFVAGYAPIYGRQILFFLDPTFLQRSKIPAPVQSDRLAVAEDTVLPQAVDLYAEALQEQRTEEHEA
ncbi:type IV secretory system conjugative DNA transfer family protein [Nitratidesulfovibrio vulgaris]|uniref:type IV secretory system conjugative DNA transfer family protein n=1 Tax=Nitratidesulfovibrio vulgaris TaxID=881 RepID=UPI0022FFC77A|nr:type IV secretory system conjugative DNA transfer family protein [Nitratidesulfovibrio vulgaris]WCB46509.1 type IV secretory system conjugative DNA transfer family protein [Nitratidesulfovibrio vulgaris]